MMVEPVKPRCRCSCHMNGSQAPCTLCKWWHREFGP